jgi:hypothetical protein
MESDRAFDVFIEIKKTLGQSFRMSSILIKKVLLFERMA